MSDRRDFVRDDELAVVSTRGGLSITRAAVMVDGKQGQVRVTLQVNVPAILPAQAARQLARENPHVQVVEHADRARRVPFKLKAV